MSKKNVLIITYYWPPSGGAGVQRWLKFVKYFGELDVDCTVITVKREKASYPVIDESLCNEIPDNVTIHYTDTLEPFGVYKKMSSAQGIPHAGFANEDTSFKKKVARFIRGNFFIPDARKGWNRFAYRKAAELIGNNHFDAVIISSPPHSSQLIGLKLKKKFNINWIADMRDPWTDIYYYKKMLHTKWALKKDAKLEKEVLSNADRIIVVSESIRQLFVSKVNRPEAITVLPNGYDTADFEKAQPTSSDPNKLVITYTGTISKDYPIDSLLEAVKAIGKDSFIFNFVGVLPPEIKEKLEEFNTHLPGYVNHTTSIEFLLASDVLLLIIPYVEKNSGILTGKLFEYLGSHRPILGLGPKNGDAAKIIEQCNAGVMLPYNDVNDIKTVLNGHLSAKAKNGSTTHSTSSEVINYSRKALTESLIKIF